MSHPRDIAAFALDCFHNRAEIALVFVTEVAGGSIRDPGLRMAIASDGRTIGQVSNGCVEADLIATALRALEIKEVTSTAYGRGSGKIDLPLPCGGRIELVIVPLTGGQTPALQAMAAAGRSAGWLLLDRGGGLAWQPEGPGNADGWQFAISPKIRLQVFGSGIDALQLARLAAGADMIAELHSPDIVTIQRARELGLSASLLQGLSGPLPCDADSWTAIALMFHDHEWELQILLGALASSAFYIGALGSERAHLRRTSALEACGVEKAQIERIKAPIGLIHRLREPNFLAVSALAEIVREFDGCGSLSGSVAMIQPPLQSSAVD